jgi:hypothetical protein|tara:strand:- start:3 stop:164 length:162 start_codon:yes stop_codon:yes gene_type:complete
MFLRFGVLCGNLPLFLKNIPPNNKIKMLTMIDIGLLYAIIMIPAVPPSCPLEI